MGERLKDEVLNKLPLPERGNKIYYDAPDKKGNVVRGFGVRVTANGTKTFIFNYRRKIDGLERRYTIGTYTASAGGWSVAAARKKAADLRREVDNFKDPVGDHREVRQAPTVAELCDRFEKEHLSKKRPSTQRDYKNAIDVHIRKHLGKRKVASLDFDDIEKMHREITKEAPYRANRTIAVLSKMLSLAVQWKYRADNPAKGIERNDEAKRRRYLSNEELSRLLSSFAEDHDQQAANIFRLLLLTGARRGEVAAAKWDDFNLADGIWIKPGATTKTRTEHRVPLSAPARQLLAGLERTEGVPFVFPDRCKKGPRGEIKRSWERICKGAGITGLRIHDLRHSYASQLASAGVGLHVIGALLGHTQPATTHRYAHLFDDPLRQATERVGAVLSGSTSKAELLTLKGGARG